MTPARYMACCDIGGTKVYLGFVDPDGNVVAADRYLIGDARSPQQMVTRLMEQFHHLAGRRGIAWEQVRGVGCSITGPLDLNREIVVSSYNLGNWENVPLKAMLESAADRPACLEMDAYAAALGEAWAGAAKGTHSLLYLVVGTGVGAGIVVEGKPLRGWRGVAGEIGHVRIEPGGPPCSCGGSGCLEALASGPALARRAMQAVTEQPDSLLAGGNLSPAGIFHAARNGDALALSLVRRQARHIGLALAGALTLLDLEAIVLGGGVLLGGIDLLLDLIRQTITENCPPWIDMSQTRLLPASRGEDAALLGVARLGLDSLR